MDEVKDYEETLVNVNEFKAKCLDELCKMVCDAQIRGDSNEQIGYDVATALFYFEKAAVLIRGGIESEKTKL